MRSRWFCLNLKLVPCRSGTVSAARAADWSCAPSPYTQVPLLSLQIIRASRLSVALIRRIPRITRVARGSCAHHAVELEPHGVLGLSGYPIEVGTFRPCAFPPAASAADLSFRCDSTKRQVHHLANPTKLTTAYVTSSSAPEMCAFADLESVLGESALASVRLTGIVMGTPISAARQ